MIDTATRILSFDGGGIRGIFQASFLASLQLDNLIPRSDILAGTSTGAIIAVALGIGKKISEIEEFYNVIGSKIFSKRANWIKHHFRGEPKYSSDTLRDALSSELKDVKFGDLHKRVIIPAVSLNTWSLYVFDSENSDDRNLSVVDILLATTAAPTFFKPHYIKANSTTWLDGGLVCNNPAFEAIFAAHKKSAADDLYVLSIGNGIHPSTQPPQDFLKKTPLAWGIGCIDICMNATSHAAHLKCEQSLKKNHYIRINKHLGNPIALDNYASAISTLPAYAREVAFENRDRIRSWLSENTFSN